MSSIGKVDVIRARLQGAGVSFSDAQLVTKKEAERASADPEYFHVARAAPDKEVRLMPDILTRYPTGVPST